jgi:hypothetical protein
MTQYITSHEESSKAGNGRGPSLATLWADCPREEILQDYSAGYCFRDDFMSLGTNDTTYAIDNATAGTFLMTDLAGGVAKADSASTTTAQGVNVQVASGATGAAFIPAADTNIWFEARIEHVTSISADVADLFIGLSEVDASVIASGANSSANHIGFELISEDAILTFENEKAGSRTSIAAVHTLVASEYVKLGFKVTGVTQIELYVNGVVFATKSITNLPIVAMTPSLACVCSGTASVDPEVNIDWWECFAEDRIVAVTE